MEYHHRNYVRKWMACLSPATFNVTASREATSGGQGCGGSGWKHRRHPSVAEGGWMGVVEREEAVFFPFTQRDIMLNFIFNCSQATVPASHQPFHDAAFLTLLLLCCTSAHPGHLGYQHTLNRAGPLFMRCVFEGGVVQTHTLEAV